MPRFSIVDCGGVVHQVNLSDDPRGVAMDALPANMSRRPSRDQSLPGSPDQLDDDVAVNAVIEILKRASNADEILQEVERIRSHASEGGENDADRRPVSRDTPAPFVGQPRPGGALDRQLAADRSFTALTKRHPDIAAMIGRVRLGGY